MMKSALSSRAGMPPALKPMLTSLVVVGLTALAACEPAPQSAAERARQQNVAAQDDIISRATSAVPVPRVNNFLAREGLAEYMRRMDDPAKTWYIYVLGNSGAQLGYYVASSYPQSVCTFMTPPEEVRSRTWSNGGGFGLTTTAPALDGIYYKGGGCETVFFFDAESSAMIMLTGMSTWASDVPLDLDVPRISVAMQADAGRPAPGSAATGDNPVGNVTTGKAAKGGEPSAAGEAQ